MRAHTRVYGTLALAAAFVAFRDSPTGQPGRVARTPSFATASDTGGGSGNQSHFNAQGDFASALWSVSGDGGFTFGSLNVFRGGPTNDPQTFLSYFIQQCDNSFNCSVSSGRGLIPNQDVRVSGKSVELNTNTAGNPNFVTSGVLPPGLVSASWQANGLGEETRTGTSELRVPGFMSRQTGRSSVASADASGSVVGFAFTSVHGNGQIGSNANVTIDIFH